MSELIKVKTSELEGEALDWAVALACFQGPVRNAAGWLFDEYGIDGDDVKATHFVPLKRKSRRGRPTWSPSRKWHHAGPLIAEKVTVTVDTENGCYADCGAQAHAVKHQKPLDEYDGSGPTILIACMRAIVSSELGPEIEVPKELVT